MPGYIDKALQRFQHESPTTPEHQPHQHTLPAYGTKVPYAKEEDTTRKVEKKEKRVIQQVVGTFLFYRRAVNNTSE